MWVSRWLLLVSCMVWTTQALHASEAGIVDWHKPLLGIPLTRPIFHRTTLDSGATKSLIVTATSNNVIGAIHPENGTLAWRYLLEEKDPIVGYKVRNNRIATLSGPGGATLRFLDVSTGSLLHETRLHVPQVGRLLQPANLGVGIAFEESGASEDSFVLTNGHTLRRIDGKSGEVAWGWSSPDQTSLVLYSNIVPTSDAVYLIGLAKSLTSYTVHLTSISPVTGELIADVDIPSSISDGPAGLLILSRNLTSGQATRLVWLEQGRIHSVSLTPQLKEKPVVNKGSAYLQLHDLSLQNEGLFVAIKEDGSGRVIKLTDDGALKSIWEFADSAHSAKHTESHYTGGLDKDGMPYIGRVFWSHLHAKASAHIFAPHLGEGKGLVAGFTFPFETSQHGIITTVAMDAANPAELQVLSRLALTTTTGSVQLWQQDQHQWTREESLTDVRVAEMVELPEPLVAASQLGAEETESFSSRLQRQLTDAQDFPQYAINFVKRFATGSYASASSSVASNDTSALFRDTFGFRKIIVAATSHGKIFGIDSANGEIVWSKVFGLGWAVEVGARVFPLKIFTLKTVGDGDVPQVAVVAQRKADNGLSDTVVFYFNALTGEDVTEASAGVDLLQGKDVIAGSLVEAYLLHHENNRFIVLLDEYLQVQLFPETPETEASFQSLAPSIHFPLRTGSAGSHRLGGHKVSTEKEFTGKHIAYPIWTASLPPNEDIRSIITRPREPVASLGKVLGNRTTLYKYLNPGIVVLLTAGGPPSGPASSCGVYAVDGVKGTILYHASVPPSGGACDVKAAFTENWLVYHYYDADAVGVDQAKSYRMVSVEFYEGSQVDDKVGSSDLTSYSDDSTKISIYEKSFVFPRGISAITTTSTKYGITIKDIVVANTNHQVQSFPRRFLDPRRPNRKPTSEEQEEWLMQYDPLIPDDPKHVLSHKYQVARIRKIITSPALLESTSLVFGYGVDLFFTRVAPSKTFDVLSENFNKIQLVLTIGGLALAILITKPMVRRKKLRERWYDS